LPSMSHCESVTFSSVATWLLLLLAAKVGSIEKLTEAEVFDATTELLLLLATKVGAMEKPTEAAVVDATTKLSNWCSWNSCMS